MTEQTATDPTITNTRTTSPYHAYEIEEWVQGGAFPDDAPALPWRYYGHSGGKVWRPNIISARWERRRDRHGDAAYPEVGPWQLDVARWSGRRVKNDGTLGESSQAQGFSEGQMRGGRIPEWTPRYIAAWVIANAPEGWTAELP